MTAETTPLLPLHLDFDHCGPRHRICYQIKLDQRNIMVWPCRPIVARATRAWAYWLIMVTAIASAFVNVAFLPLYELVDVADARRERVGPIVAQLPWNFMTIIYTIALFLSMPFALLVVRGKWAHGRTFTSLLADFIILSLLAAYGIATNIAKTCLGHAVFFGAYGERSARVAWGVGAASLVLNWSTATILVLVLAFEAVWTYSARRSGLHAPRNRPFAYEAPVRAAAFSIDDDEAKAAAAPEGHDSEKLQAKITPLASPQSPAFASATSASGSRRSSRPLLGALNTGSHLTTATALTSPTSPGAPRQQSEDLPGYFEGNSTAAAYYAAAAAYIAAAELAAGGGSAGSGDVRRSRGGPRRAGLIGGGEGLSDTPEAVDSEPRISPRRGSSEKRPAFPAPSGAPSDIDPTLAVRRMSSPLDALKLDTLAMLHHSERHSASGSRRERASLPVLPSARTEAVAAVRARGEPRYGVGSDGGYGGVEVGEGASDLPAWKRTVLDALAREGREDEGEQEMSQWKRDVLDALERAEVSGSTPSGPRGL